MRHADLRREAAAAIAAKAVSALLNDTAVSYLVYVGVYMGVWPCVCFCGGISDSIGFPNFSD